MAIVTASMISKGLGAIGVVHGDIMMVHSSLRSFGSVDDGADAVVDAMIDAVGEGGTVIVPTLTSTLAESVHKELTGQAFDIDETPSRVGLITETLRKRPEARRSSHPTHSVAAIGAAAAEMVAGHGPTTFNVAGPYGKYCAGNAMIVFLGARRTQNTTLHAVEEWMAMPYLETIKAMVLEEGVPRAVDCPAFPSGDRGFYKNECPIHGMHDAAGILRTTKIGRCQVVAMRAHDLVRETALAERDNPGVLLCSDPNCDFCAAGRARIVQNRAPVEAAIESLLASPQAGAA